MRSPALALLRWIFYCRDRALGYSGDPNYLTLCQNLSHTGRMPFTQKSDFYLEQRTLCVSRGITYHPTYDSPDYPKTVIKMLVFTYVLTVLRRIVKALFAFLVVLSWFASSLYLQIVHPS